MRSFWRSSLELWQISRDDRVNLQQLQQAWAVLMSLTPLVLGTAPSPTISQTTFNILQAALRRSSRSFSWRCAFICIARAAWASQLAGTKQHDELSSVHAMGHTEAAFGCCAPESCRGNRVLQLDDQQVYRLLVQSRRADLQGMDAGIVNGGQLGELSSIRLRTS